VTGPLATAAATALALAASAAFAAASVLQQHEARTAPTRHALHPQLILDLLRRRVWLAGSVAGVVGFVLEALALYFGPITLVQPLIITELLFALPLAARLSGGRLRPREWVGAGLVVSGLAVFLSSAAPSRGRSEISAPNGLAVLTVVAAIVVSALLVAPRRRGVLRTSMFATATGVTFGAMSSFLKAVVGLLAARGLGAIAAWQLWVLVALALSGLVLSQSSFQAGPLAVSLPLIDTLIPVTAGVIAVAAFGEHINHTPFIAYVEVLSAAATIAGIAVLDSSPLVRRSERDR
jgi:drug/metabolite transporter (DMT)-like permease